MDNRPLVSVRDAALSLGVGPATVYRLCRAGSIPSVRVGKAIRVHPSTVDAIRRQGQTTTAGQAAILANFDPESGEILPENVPEIEYLDALKRPTEDD